MNIEEVREYCLSLKNTIECCPFYEVSLVFKVENKMFLLLPLDAEEPHVSLKCSTDYVEELREHYTCLLYTSREWIFGSGKYCYIRAVLLLRPISMSSCCWLSRRAGISGSGLALGVRFAAPCLWPFAFG